MGHNTCSPSTFLPPILGRLESRDLTTSPPTLYQSKEPWSLTSLILSVAFGKRPISNVSIPLPFFPNMLPVPYLIGSIDVKWFLRVGGNFLEKVIFNVVLCS